MAGIRSIKITFIVFLGFVFSTITCYAVTTTIGLDEKDRGISSFTHCPGDNARNYINRNDYLGDMSVRYVISGEVYEVNLSDMSPMVISNDLQQVCIEWQLPGSLKLRQTFSIIGTDMDWVISFSNNNKQAAEITDLKVRMPIGRWVESLPAKDNLAKHIFLNGHSSYIYWLPYKGQGNN